jgi:hypothetical protein
VCRIGPRPFVEKAERGRRNHAGTGAGMSEYLVAFNRGRTPDHSHREEP